METDEGTRRLTICVRVRALCSLSGKSCHLGGESMKSLIYPPSCGRDLARWRLARYATTRQSLHTRFSRMSETATVSVTQGGLKGRKVLTKSGLQYYSFQGIPYAKPPVGDLRFKVSNFILRKEENQFFNFQLHSCTSTAYTVVTVCTSCSNVQKQLHFVHSVVCAFCMKLA